MDWYAIRLISTSLFLRTMKVMQDQVLKTGAEVKFAATARAYSFVGTLSSLVGLRSEPESEAQPQPAEENNS